MKDRFGIFINILFLRTPNKFKKIKRFWMVLTSFKDKK